MTACGSLTRSRSMWAKQATWSSTTRYCPTPIRAKPLSWATCAAPWNSTWSAPASIGLPCGLSADWNDCLRLGYYGESLFVAFQVRLGLTIYAEIAERLGKPKETAWALAQREILDASIQACAWDGDWFIWAIGEDGTVYGTREYEEGQVYLNTQLWAVISGAATPEQASRCMADRPGAPGYPVRPDAVRSALCQDAHRRHARRGL